MTAADSSSNDFHSHFPDDHHCCLR